MPLPDREWYSAGTGVGKRNATGVPVVLMNSVVVVFGKKWWCFSSHFPCVVNGLCAASLLVSQSLGTMTSIATGKLIAKHLKI